MFAQHRHIEGKSLPAAATSMALSTKLADAQVSDKTGRTWQNKYQDTYFELYSWTIAAASGSSCEDIHAATRLHDSRGARGLYTVWPVSVRWQWWGEEGDSFDQVHPLTSMSAMLWMTLGSKSSLSPARYISDSTYVHCSYLTTYLANQTSKSHALGSPA